MSDYTPVSSSAKMKSGEEFSRHLARRNRVGGIWARFFFISNFIGLFVLILLLGHVANSAFGLATIRNTVEPSTLSDQPLEELDEPALVAILVENVPNRLRVMMRDKLSRVDPVDFTVAPVADVLEGSIYPEEYADDLIAELPVEVQAQILSDNLSRDEVYDLVQDNVVRPVVVRAWKLIESIFERERIEAEFAERYADDNLVFRSWLSWDFVTSSVSSSATTAGLRTALYGSFWIITITALTSLIIGVAAAIYLEEYAIDNWINRIIEINIRNLAAIPSIIYGMLGLAVFAQSLAVITGGYMFGQNLPSQAPDQIVAFVQEAFDEPTLTGAGRQEIRDAVFAARGNQDLIYDVIAEGITTPVLDDNQKEALVRLFQSYREPSLASFALFSTPTDEQILNDLARVLPLEQLSQGTIDKLQASLKTYGTFNINGRTVVSAGITLALLILPLIIVNAQEAIRAVPSSIREASYGLGATKWQTTWRQVLPAALPSIMTGVILAISRAIGETAPLLVVGASTFIGIDPNGPFSKFTVIPIQIYQWTSRPEQEFRSVAAAAIIVLLVVMLIMNGTAIFIRNRFSRRY